MWPTLWEPMPTSSLQPGLLHVMTHHVRGTLHDWLNKCLKHQHKAAPSAQVCKPSAASRASICRREMRRTSLASSSDSFMLTCAVGGTCMIAGSVNVKHLKGQMLQEECCAAAPCWHCWRCCANVQVWQCS